MTLVYDRLAALDSRDIAGLQIGLPDQFRQGASLAVSAPPLPMGPEDCTSLILSGMGGSAIAGDLTRSLWSDELKVPLTVHRGYGLPGHAGSRTLLICASYSGNTEETLSAYAEARRRGVPTYCIATGGELLARAAGDGVPYCTIPPGLPPRCALGYSLSPLLVLLGRAGFTPSALAMIQSAADFLDAQNRFYAPNVPEEKNFALEMARLLEGRITLLYAGNERLESVARRIKGQINEHAGHPAWTAEMPELCHNEIVGWERVAVLGDRVRVLFLRDKEDHPRVSARFEIIRTILEKAGVPVTVLMTVGESRLERLLSLVQLGDWVAYYLAILTGKDPFAIPEIDFLKDEMKKV